MHKEKRQTLGIIGLGAFGRFMARHLAPYFEVSGWDVVQPEMELLRKDGVESLKIPSFEEVCRSDILIFSVPLDALEEAVQKSAPYIKASALTIEVTSVKVKPVDIMLRYLPEHADYLALHPLFGPQSGKDGIDGMRIMAYPARIPQERYYAACDFLSMRLKLAVLRSTPEEHDMEMAKVQAVTHFVSRGLKSVSLSASPFATKGYERLLEFANITLSDSWDLFLTIQNGNPHARVLRKKLLAELRSLEKRLEEADSLSSS